MERLTVADLEKLAGFGLKDFDVEIVDRDAVPWDDMEVVDCGANPFDLRPAAEAIARRIEERLSASGDGRLLVQFGEAHDRPAHLALEQMVVARLVGNGLAGSLTVAFELPANLLGLAGRGGGDGYAMAAADPDGDACLTHLVTRYAGVEAPVSLHNFAAFLRGARVRTIFNDAGRVRVRDERFLDPGDPFFTARGIAVPEGTSAGSNEGMSLRNVRMAGTARAQGGLVLQIAGVRHIFGNGGQRSLTACMREGGRDVLTILLAMPAVTTGGSRALYVRGLCAASFIHEEDDDEHALEMAERGVLRTILKESGFHEGFMLGGSDGVPRAVPA